MPQASVSCRTTRRTTSAPAVSPAFTRDNVNCALIAVRLVVNQNSALSDARGGVVKRNSEFSPWVNNVDVRFSQEVPGFRPSHKGAIIFDILNFGNLLNRKWGHIDEMAFQGQGGQIRTFTNFVGIDPASGKYIYSTRTPDDFTTRQNRGESQWAMQITFRYEF